MIICKWSHGTDIYEFDAKNKAEEMRKVRKIAKNNNIKFKDMVKEG